MPVDLSIKRVPTDVARRLRKRAEAHHRSLQGELMAILRAAVEEGGESTTSLAGEAAPVYAARTPQRIASASESALIIRQAREGRTCTIADLHRFVSALGTPTPDESTSWIQRERSRR